jgi:hypothetical protein
MYKKLSAAGGGVGFALAGFLLNVPLLYGLSVLSFAFLLSSSCAT